MADSFSGPGLILLGLSILVIGFLLRRSIVLAGRSRKRDPASEVRSDIAATERSAAAGIRKLEVRLHDYGREVEGRVQTTLTLLDRLILEADRESDRLLRLLGDAEIAAREDAGLQQGANARRSPDIVTPGDTSSIVPGNRGGVPSPSTTLSHEEQDMVRQLHGGGYTIGQIARLLRRPLDEVRLALPPGDATAGEDRADAA